MSDMISNGIQGAIHGILSDYEKGRSIDKLDVFRQPDRRMITELTEKLFRVVYPGFFKDRSYRVYNVKNNLSLVIEDIAYLLNKQIAIALEYNLHSGGESEDIEGRSQLITLEFLKKIPAIREFIETDVQATMDGDPAAYSEDEIIFSYPGIHAITVHRLAHALHGLAGCGAVDVPPDVPLGALVFLDERDAGRLHDGAAHVGAGAAVLVAQRQRKRERARRAVRVPC